MSTVEPLLALVGSGRPARVYLAAAHWLFATDLEDARALLADTLADPAVRSVYWVVPGPVGAVPEGWSSGIDRVYAGTGSPSDPGGILSGDAFIDALDRLDPELADRVAPPAIRAGLPFRFHGLLHDGRIVAMCDTTVDDGEWVAIQQVNTVERLRGRGLATTLVRAVIGHAHREQRRVVWVCDEQNLPSRSVAERVGLLLHSEVSLLVRSAVEGS